MLIHKFLPIELSKVKADEESTGGRRFSGYLSTFGNVDSYGDIILPGAFAKTLAHRQWPVQMFYNHRLGAIGKYPLLEEDDAGLKFEGELTPGHSKASDVEAGLKHGAITGMSIGFMIPKGGAVPRDPENDPSGWKGLVIKEIDLFEGSVVDMPANVLAQITDVRDALGATLLRDLEQATTIREIEEVLRGSAGFSRRAVEVLTTRQKAVLEAPLREQITGLEKTVAALRAEKEIRAFAGRIGQR